VGSVLGWFFPYLGTFFRENYPKHHPSIKPSYGINREGFLLNLPLWIRQLLIITKFSSVSLKNKPHQGTLGPKNRLPKLPTAKSSKLSSY
jgi:hypothetical protein